MRKFGRHSQALTGLEFDVARVKAVAAITPEEQALLART